MRKLQEKILVTIGLPHMQSIMKMHLKRSQTFFPHLGPILLLGVMIHLVTACGPIKESVTIRPKSLSLAQNPKTPTAN